MVSLLHSNYHCTYFFYFVSVMVQYGLRVFVESIKPLGNSFFIIVCTTAGFTSLQQASFHDVIRHIKEQKERALTNL